MSILLKIPLVLDPQKEGGWTVTSPIFPELVTEVDDITELHKIVQDALGAVLELYHDAGRKLPLTAISNEENKPVWFESLISAEG
jgi:antitoxin HicB